MNKDCIIDYTSFICFKVSGFLVRMLPKRISLFLGRRLGDLFYYFNPKLKARAYANVKTALGRELPPQQLTKVTRAFFSNFGQNFIEIFFVPLIDKEYIAKYISAPGLENVFTALKEGKGAILLAVHAGSWELSNITASNLGFPMRTLVRPQTKFGRIESLLNLYRKQKGCKIIERRNETRQIIEVLKSNEAVGMTVDQGGKTGELVTFFGLEASMATGAVRLALKYGVPILPCYYTRIKGPYIKIIIDPPFTVTKTGDVNKDLRDNLQNLAKVFEKYISMYPQEYLWTYKIWKYGRDRKILILDDGKTGHLRQSEAAANLTAGILKQRGLNAQVETTGVKFRHKFSGLALMLSGLLAGKYRCQGCLSCLRMSLEEKTYRDLISRRADIVISCGSRTAAINFLIARENLARSIVIMKPSVLSTKKFDLVIMPRHDNPPKRKNIIVTEAALNLIDEAYLNGQSQRLLQHLTVKPAQAAIGLLIGGDSKNFRLEPRTLQDVISQVKTISQKLNMDILVTTSRRTSGELENLVKRELRDYPRCKLLVIANEKNIPESVGGMLGLSDILIISPESISMVSEAVSSNKYVLVFNSAHLSARHEYFLDYLSRHKYIYRVDTGNIASRIEELLLAKPAVNSLRDNAIVSDALSRIL